MPELTINFRACFQLTKDSRKMQHRRQFSLSRSNSNWAETIQKSVSETGNNHLNRLLWKYNFTKEERQRLISQGVVRFWLEVDGKRSMLHPEVLERSLEDFLEYFEMIRPSSDKNVVLYAALDAGVWNE